MTSETIYVSKEAYKALKDISSKQRGCKALTPEQYEKCLPGYPAHRP